MSLSEPGSAASLTSASRDSSIRSVTTSAGTSIRSFLRQGPASVTVQEPDSLRG